MHVYCYVLECDDQDRAEVLVRNYVNVRRSEESRHKSKKKIILWHRCLLDIVLYQSPKIALKITENSPLYSILMLKFLKIFKRKFLFSSIFSKFCLKKIFIWWHSGLLGMFLCQYLKPAPNNTQNSPLYSILKLTFLEVFKNKSFCFFQFFRNFVFHFMPGFLKLLCKYYNVITFKPNSH